MAPGEGGETARCATRREPSRRAAPSSLYPTPHSLSTSSAVSSAARSLRRSREACASSVRVRECAGNPQTSRSSSAFVKTRSGSEASRTSSSYSFCESSTRRPDNVTTRARRSIESGPATSGADATPDRRKHRAHPLDELVVVERPRDVVVAAPAERHVRARLRRPRRRPSTITGASPRQRSSAASSPASTRSGAQPGSASSNPSPFSCRSSSCASPARAQSATPSSTFSRR